MHLSIRHLAKNCCRQTCLHANFIFLSSLSLSFARSIRLCSSRLIVLFIVMSLYQNTCNHEYISHSQSSFGVHQLQHSITFIITVCSCVSHNTPYRLSVLLFFLLFFFNFEICPQVTLSNSLLHHIAVIKLQQIFLFQKLCTNEETVGQ